MWSSACRILSNSVFSAASEQRRPQLIVFLSGLPAIGLYETESFLQLAVHQSHITL
jgi:hypothetical protein